MKHLLIVYHSQSCRTEALAHAVWRGASIDDIDEVEVRLKLAGEAGVCDLLWANALILGTPENFGYMSGAMKDFLDRTFYPVQGKVDGLPYAMFISAGNDGTGAVRAYEAMLYGEERDNPAVRAQWKEALLRYCKLDTAAMVMIWEYWGRRTHSQPSSV